MTMQKRAQKEQQPEKIASLNFELLPVVSLMPPPVSSTLPQRARRLRLILEVSPKTPALQPSVDWALPISSLAETAVHHPSAAETIYQQHRRRHRAWPVCSSPPLLMRAIRCCYCQPLFRIRCCPVFSCSVLNLPSCCSPPAIDTHSSLPNACPS